MGHCELSSGEPHCVCNEGTELINGQCVYPPTLSWCQIVHPQEMVNNSDGVLFTAYAQVYGGILTEQNIFDSAYSIGRDLIQISSPEAINYPITEDDYGNPVIAIHNPHCANCGNNHEYAAEIPEKSAYYTFYFIFKFTLYKNDVPVQEIFCDTNGVISSGEISPIIYRQTY